MQNNRYNYVALAVHKCIIARIGQRALVGKVNMDSQSSVSYIESTENSVMDTLKFIESVEGMKVY